MKSYWMGAMLILGTAVSASAQKLPRGAFQADKFDEAKAEAVAEGKPLAVIITDTKSTCPKCEAGNAEAFNYLKRKYVMVVEDKASGGTLPQGVKQKVLPVYTSKGNIIPIVGVVANDDFRLLGGLCYKQISVDARKAFRTLDQEVEESLAQGGAAAAPENPAKKPESEGYQKADDTVASRDWTNSEGKTIRAAAVAYDSGKVSFRLENGKLVDYPLEKLSAASRKVLAEAFAGSGIDTE